MEDVKKGKNFGEIINKESKFTTQQKIKNIEMEEEITSSQQLEQIIDTKELLLSKDYFSISQHIEEDRDNEINQEDLLHDHLLFNKIVGNLNLNDQ